MIEYKYNAVGWLTQCPTSDCNYKTALQRATVEELQKVISQMSGKPGNKSRITACERELRRRSKII